MSSKVEMLRCKSIAEKTCHNDLKPSAQNVGGVNWPDRFTSFNACQVVKPGVNRKWNRQEVTDLLSTCKLLSSASTS